MRPTAYFLALILGTTTSMSGFSQMLNIDASKDHQRIDGFGASGAWWSQDVGRMTDDARNSLADFLFSKDKGLGFSVYRYNLGGGPGNSISDPWRRTAGIEDGQGKIDLRKDAGALWFFKAALDRGVETTVAFVNSPGARFTINHRTDGSDTGASNLDPSQYLAWSQDLVGQIQSLQKAGFRVDWLSPINEPDNVWQPANGQEGCSYSPSEAAALLKVLIPTVKQGLPGIKISAPENGKWLSARSYLAAFAREPEVLQGIDGWALHSYWSAQDEKQRISDYFQKKAPALPVWMSEFCFMENGSPDYSIEGGISMARLIQEDLVVGNATSWQWWIAVSKYLYQDGLVYLDGTGAHGWKAGKRAWALGHWSRFVRPGWVRVDAGVDGDDSGMSASAFRSPDGKSLAIVVINGSRDAHVLTPGAGLSGWEPQSRYTTSEKADMAQASPEAAWSIEPRSISTILLAR